MKRYHGLGNSNLFLHPRPAAFAPGECLSVPEDQARIESLAHLLSVGTHQ